MERRFFSGNTLEQAVLAAARSYKLDPQRVAYSLREKKHGFVNQRRRVVIEIDPQAPEKSAEQVEMAQQEADRQTEQERQERQATVARQARGSRPDSGPRRQSGPREGGLRGAERWHDRQGSGRDSDRPAKDPFVETPMEDRVPFEEIEELAPLAAVQKAIEVLLQLGDLDVSPSVEETDECFHAELSGIDSDRLIEEDGQLLLVLEHLLPRVARGYCGIGLQCSVDCEGYRAKHEENLRQLAARSAEEVRDDQLAKELEAMNPADRRIIHITLADDPGVVTESHGEGFFKCVTIYPS